MRRLLLRVWGESCGSVFPQRRLASAAASAAPSNPLLSESSFESSSLGAFEFESLSSNHAWAQPDPEARTPGTVKLRESRGRAAGLPKRIRGVYRLLVDEKRQDRTSPASLLNVHRIDSQILRTFSSVLPIRPAQDQEEVPWLVREPEAAGEAGLLLCARPIPQSHHY